jgi:hypothetical protein
MLTEFNLVSIFNSTTQKVMNADILILRAVWQEKAVSVLISPTTASSTLQTDAVAFSLLLYPAALI